MLERRGKLMKVFVLCGGKGTRLRPYTDTAPKPMLRIGGRPILEYVIANLRKNGIKDIVLTVGYLKEKIIGHFGDGSKFGVKITYLIEEEEELKTAGSILPGRKLVGPGENFLVIMGDSILGLDISAFARSHEGSNAVATIALKEEEVHFEYGMVEVEDGKVRKFSEKPTIKYFANAGAYVFKPEIFGYIRDKSDFAHDVFPALLKAGKEIRAHPFLEYWVDVGRKADYERYAEKGVLEKILGKDFGK